MSGSQEHTAAAVGLSVVASLGAKGVLSLLPSYGVARLWGADRGELLRWSGGRRWVHRFLALRDEVSPEQVLEEAGAKGVRFIPYGDPEYCTGLFRLAQPPAGLFVTGSREAWSRLHTIPRVAIVGTRRSTRYGDSAAYRIARGFAEAGVGVMSGLALGVDGQAHRGALDGEGLTGAVLGSGPDVVYPARHRELHSRVLGRGAVISEYPPGTRPCPWSFPERNRLLAALSDAVLVVEAPVRSGALITAQHALDLGKDVFAVPGPILGGRSDGSNRLIYDGAVPCLDPVSVVQEFLVNTRMEREGRSPGPTLAGTRQGPDALGVKERLVVLALSARAAGVAEIAEASGLDIRETSVALTVLELGGRVVRQGSGRYALG